MVAIRLCGYEETRDCNRAVVAPHCTEPVKKKPLQPDQKPRRASPAPAERAFERALDRLGVGLCELSLDGAFLEVNERLCRLTGYSRAELAGRPFGSFSAPEDVPREREALAAVGAAPGLPVSYEKHCRTKDGALLWVAVTLSQERAGRRRFLVGVVEDITARKQAAAAVERSQALLAHAERVAQVGSWSEDLVARRVEWSEEIYRILELDPAAVAPSLEGFRSRVHPEDLPGLARAVREADAFRPYEAEHRLLMPDGRVKYVKSRGETTFDAAGRPLRTVGTVQDVTRQHLADQALSEQEARLKVVFDSTSEAMVVLRVADGQARLAYFNRNAMERVRGDDPSTTEDELRGLSLEEARARHPAFARNYPVLYETVGRVLAGEPLVVAERRVERAGAHFDLEVRVSGIYGPAGRLTGVLCVGRDVTARKAHEEALQRSLAEKEVLLRETHHRVKNNLQVVSSMLALQGEASHDERFQALVQESRARIQTMALVHEQLYRTSAFSSVDLGAHLGELAAMAHRAYGGARVSLVTAVEQVPVGIGTALPVGLLCNELLSNAFKHGFPGARRGTVTVGCQARGGQVTVTVKDDGVGLPSGLVAASRTLGFRIVNTLVRQVGGTLTAGAEGGTTFTLTFTPDARG